tara:strand:+ start:5039 stop:6247 length:1209 start_codon:yes stop_codon:yes gene_type:complete
MSIKLSNNIENIPPSATMLMTQLARDLKSEGKDIVSMSAGEPDFDTPQNIKNSAIDAIKRGETKYTAVDGIDELKQAVIDKFEKENNLYFEKKNISVAPGGKSIIYNAIFSTINPGDEVIIPAPFWVSYPDIVKLAGGNPVIIKTSSENNFKISANQLEKSITDKTKWLFINSPSNPTGQVYSKSELTEIIKVLKKYKNVYILSDDIYEYIRYKNHDKFYTIAELDDEIFSRTITMNGVSKAYSMTGWRIGYCGGPVEIINAMRKLMGQSTSNPSSISQWASVEALNGSRDFLQNWIPSFRERRDYIVDYLNNCDGIECLNPEGAFYVYPSCAGIIGKKFKDKVIASDKDFAMILLKEKLVSVVHGEAFGLSPFFRISYATSMENIKIACNRIGELCNEVSY